MIIFAIRGVGLDVKTPSFGIFKSELAIIDRSGEGVIRIFFLLVEFGVHFFGVFVDGFIDGGVDLGLQVVRGFIPADVHPDEETNKSREKEGEDNDGDGLGEAGVARFFGGANHGWSWSRRNRIWTGGAGRDRGTRIHRAWSARGGIGICEVCGGGAHRSGVRGSDIRVCGIFLSWIAGRGREITTISRIVLSATVWVGTVRNWRAGIQAIFIHSFIIHDFWLFERFFRFSSFYGFRIFHEW